MTACRRQRLERVPDLAGLAAAHPGRFPYLLESAARGGLGRASLLLFAGDEVLTAGHGEDGGHRDFFAELDAWYRAEATATAADGALPFSGGWFVYLGYEMAARVEPVLRPPASPHGLPDAIAHRCPGAVIVLHGAGVDEDRAWAVAEDRESLDEICSLAEQAPAFRPARCYGANPILAELIEEDPERFRASVRRIHEYLAAGDVFQVNVSRPWSGAFRFEPDPARLYEALMQHNPAPFAGMMRWGGDVLLSSSPERLVQVRGRRVQTRPIAGTRPRGHDARRDRALSRELISDLKERAEHVMLIDLERNDLGRVCRPGSIEVNELMVLETYAHVHHIVSNVRGELRDGSSPVDAVRAAFPGGTITGCPKVRCMEIISELEGEGRGYYTGSMGYLGRDGSLDLNILIRSMLLSGKRFHFRTGAGIVADSDPGREVLETADKARGMLLTVQSLGRERKHA